MKEELVWVAFFVMVAVGTVAYNWRTVRIAEINAEVQKVQAEQGKKFKFGTTKDE